MSAEKCVNKIGFIFSNAFIKLFDDCCDSSSSSSCNSSSSSSCRNYASSSSSICKKANKYDFFSTESASSNSSLCSSSKSSKSSKKKSKCKKCNSSSSCSCQNVPFSSLDSKNLSLNTNSTGNLDFKYPGVFTNSSCTPTCKPIFSNNPYANPYSNICGPSYDCCGKTACVKRYCSPLFGGTPKFCSVELCKFDLVSQTLALATTFEECWNGFVANLYQLLKGSFLISFNKCGIIITIYAQLFKYKYCKDSDSIKLYFKYNIVPPSGECQNEIKKVDIYYKLHNEKVSDVRFYYDANNPFNPIRYIVYPET